MIKEYGINNYKVLINKLKKINNLDIDDLLNKLGNKVICVGSGASISTAYFISKILNNYYNKETIWTTPRELLNMNIENNSILVLSYSGTSKDTLYIKNNYKNVFILTGRCIDEFEDKNNIYSYYLNEEYERGLILYENIIIPISLLINKLDKKIVEKEISEFNKYQIDLSNINKIALFTGTYATTSVLYLEDKIKETGICNVDIYDKKDFSHGKYNYFMNNEYDIVIYFKSNNISTYEELLINTLKDKCDLLIVESNYNDIQAEYDLIFKSFIIFNELLKNKDINNYNKEYEKLYKFEGDFK